MKNLYIHLENYNLEFGLMGIHYIGMNHHLLLPQDYNYLQFHLYIHIYPLQVDNHHHHFHSRLNHSHIVDLLHRNIHHLTSHQNNNHRLQSNLKAHPQDTDYHIHKYHHLCLLLGCSFELLAQYLSLIHIS